MTPERYAYVEQVKEIIRSDMRDWLRPLPSINACVMVEWLAIATLDFYEFTEGRYDSIQRDLQAARDRRRGLRPLAMAEVSHEQG